MNRRVDIGDGVCLNVHDSGPDSLGRGPSIDPQGGGRGAPIVFLHGSGPGASGLSNFGPNLQAFHASGFRTLLVDSLGYGLSDKPLVDYDLATMSGAVVSLLDALDLPRVTLVGNSHGGAQCIRIALEQPERVERLILMAPGGLEARETYMQMRGIRSMLRCVFGPEGITRAGMAKVFQRQLYDPTQIDEALIDARYQVALTQPRRVFETLRVDNQEERLGELACPVLGLWGADDLFCPVSGAAKLAGRCADARVTVFSRCGHWVMVERKAVFERLCVDFLCQG